MQKLKIVLRIVSSLAFVIGVPLLVRSCLFSEGKWVTCRIRTEVGEIHVRIYPDQAPVTAANFLRYVEAGLYNHTNFFRVLTPANQPDDPFRIEVIQGGAVDEKKCFPAITHETTKMTGLSHKDGTISMARAGPGTAACSFFICIGRQPELDYGGRRNPDGQGFAAFGRVVKGMDVVRRIQKMNQDRQFLKNPVAITSLIRMLKPSDLPGHNGIGNWSPRVGSIRDIWDALRYSISRMAFKDFAFLLTLLVLFGWMIWHGNPPRKFGRVEREFSYNGWESTSPGLRLLATIFLLALWAFFFIILLGN
jgi:peptidyl-prolyl cis-trans isomerase A (cyclophilin A)